MKDDAKQINNKQRNTMTHYENQWTAHNNNETTMKNHDKHIKTMINTDTAMKRNEDTGKAMNNDEQHEEHTLNMTKRNE